MATLRDPLFNADLNLSAQKQQQLEVADMGSLRRGWEAGRVGNELNPLYTDELEAGIAGDEAKRQALRSQIEALKQKQSLYAPEVGRVEDIHGVGDGLSWLGGQVGQGAASMADPMAVSAGLSTAGRIAGAIPHPLAKGLGYAAQGAGMLVPALMSKQQLTGEFIGNAEQDQELMARTSPQALRDMAGDYGSLAAIPDSFLPGMVGRQLSGLTRAGSQVARQGVVGAGAKTALGMGVEGGTEALQSAGSQYAQGVLNPNRDTSGDFMENVNSFAGGAVGAGPFAGAGALAEAGHNRIDGGVDAVKGVAGDVIDLANENPTVQAGVDGAKKLWGSAKEKAAGLTGSTIDIMSDEDGKVSASALMENLKAGGQELKSRAQTSLDDHRVLSLTPPDEIAMDADKSMKWMNDTLPKRTELITSKLGASDDPQAATLMEAITSATDSATQDAALDAAAEFVLGQTPVGRAEERANSFGESMGKIAGVVGPAIGKGLVATGKAALGFGKSVLSGAQDGMRKKNEQSDGPEDFMAWRDRYYGVQGKELAAKALTEADPVATQRADLAGNYVADMAGRLNKKQPNMALLARHAAFTLADTVMRVNAKGIGQQNVKLNRLVDDLYGAFKAETPEVLTQLGAIMGPKAAPVFAYMAKEVAARGAPGAAQAQAATRDALAGQVVGLVDPAAQNTLMAQGINLNTPRGREQLLGIMEDFADGISSKPGMRKALDSTFGPESVENILNLLDTDRESDVLLPEVDAQAVKDGEKEFAKGSGQKVYGFSKAPNLRTSSERHDMFGAMTKSEAGEAVQRPQLFVKGQRLSPEYLAKLTKDMTINERVEWMKNPENTSAAAKKIADVRKQLQDDPDYPDHDNHRVVEKSAYEVMTESNMQPTKILQLYRDYLTMDGNTEEAAHMASLLAKVVRIKKGTDGQKAGMADPAARKARSEKAAAWSAANPDKSVEDYKAELSAGKMTALEGPLAEAAAAAKDYFSAHSMVVGEQLSNQDSGRITLPDILNLHKEGTGLIERARKADTEAGEQTQLALSDANVLMFKDAKDPKKTFAIPAGKLVNWVKQARGKTEASDAEDTSGSHSGKAKDEAYLADVMEGIATLIGSGYVSGMPYKVNQFGKVESFNGGVPGSLRLATKTAGALQMGAKTRREKRGRIGNEAFQGADQDAVAADQNRNDEFFTADDRAERDLVVNDPQGVRSKRRSGKDDTREAAYATDEGGELVTRDVGRGTSTKIRADVSGKVVADPKTSRDDKTELDFSKKPKDGVPDEYANQRWLSVQTGATTASSIGPEPKGTAASSAEFRAGAITDAFINEPAKGQEMIRSRIRSAMRPEYSEDKNAVVGGVHYIAPVAYFASAKNISKNNLDLPAATIAAIQGKVANLLLKGEVSLTEKIKIARLLFEGTDTKVTSMNVDAVLGRLAAGPAVKAAPVVTKQEAVAPKGDILSKAIAKRQDYLNNPPDDYTSEQAQAVADWAKSQLKRVLAQQEAEKDADFDRQDQLSDYKTDLLLLQKKAAEQLKNDQDVAEADVRDGTNLFGGNPDKSAPGVANAGLPKDRLTQSGGRKLNAMAVSIHTDLQRDGFAATHDSPIRHEGKFDWRKHTGRGEGNASFGAGTYLSTADGVHRSYKDQFTAKILETVGSEGTFSVRGREGSFTTDEEGGFDIYFPGASAVERSIVDSMLSGNSFKEAVEGFKKHAERWFKASEDFGSAPDLADAYVRMGERKSIQQHIVNSLAPSLKRSAEIWNKKVASHNAALAEIAVMKASDFIVAPPVSAVSPTYEVSVNIKPEQLLDWDKPLSEQSEAVQDALHGHELFTDETGSEREIKRSRRSGFYGLTDPDGSKIYSVLKNRLGSQAKASEYLQSLGILGHKYAASGGQNDTHPNYVIYDDSKITTNYVHFNQQQGNARVASQQEMDAAKNYALKTLGPKIKVDFKDITGYSGEFLDAQNVIEISTTAAAGTMGTLYHEAMHVFFRDFVKGNPKLQAVFETLINDPKHLAKLNSLLDGYPAAQAQLTSGEERLAYTYQFWKAGLLQVDTKAHTWLQKLGKFFRHVLGRIRDSERALELFQAFDNGKMSEPSAAGTVIATAMNRGSNALKARAQTDALRQRIAALVIPAGEILGKSTSPTARKLSAMLFTNPGEEAHGSEKIGMMNARRNVAQQYTNVSNRRFETMSEVDKAAVQKYLQSGADPHTIADKEQREAVNDIRHLLDRFHKYMTDAGLKIGKIDNYYPVVWNPNLLNANKKEFVSMLVTKYADQMGASNPHKAAERIWQSLVDKEGVDAHLPAGREDGVLSPFFASQEMRTLPWLDAADREKYLDKNMPLTLTRYFAQGAHATEYFRRFGENGIRLEKMLADINVELSGVSKEMMKRGEVKDEPARVKWVARQMRDISQSVGAMEGSLGKDVSPSMRTFNSWMAVYQNIRLLPMALFSSFVDPLALVARGAPLQAAYETFVYSMREVFRGWADAFKDMPPERQKDEWRQLAEHVGASEIAMFQHHVSDEYSSTYMTPGAKKLNDKMFTFNGMEAWNRGSRIMATKWAVRFIEKHASLPDKNHSERWLKELGLQSSQIVMDDGRLVTSPQQLAVLKGITLDDARERMAPIHDAINRWVEGAVLTPNAAQRPAWSSDPNYASAFHLKQFSYSFHQTILKRAANELNHGNIAPLGALALFIPTMIGSDIIKGLIQGGGSLPPYMASMNAGDWMMHGVQRAGLSGIGVIGVDAASDWASLGGPAFEQIVDAARDGFGSKTILNAAPVHALYGQLVS